MVYFFRDVLHNQDATNTTGGHFLLAKHKPDQVPSIAQTL
jgi:hypothetical protein